MEGGVKLLGINLGRILSLGLPLSLALANLYIIFFMSELQIYHTGAVLTR